MISVSYASATNQRLDAAKRLLALAQSSEETWLVSSFEGSALFQLRSAFNGLLQEVAQSYALSDCLDVVALANEAEAKQSIVPVLSELKDLMAQPRSWCCQLLSAYQQQLECHLVQSSFDRADLIGSGGDDGASMQLYLTRLTDLVLRFREESSEY
ncbi:DUF6586 family protein [Marinomonas aquiplantarum]|uniref:Uncharacterized protein n=1 Tax=Marinomonas aquiplantarum TaxID=491951 RepID=A0A366CYL7_9GAMM|nr:DUF6586 family protein [Marinomonas aquiplantarum]RBO82776.1 hypothetical protein DFP76_105249 [Marinomonas aquiplantarum]